MNDIFRRCAAFAFWITSLAALAGCGGFESTGAGPAAETPAYRVGDRWVYNGRDGFRVLTTWEETHTISTVGADGISERITVKGPTLDLARTERMIAPGRITVGALYENETRRFATPVDRYRFPLAAGAMWSQFVNNFDETTKTSGQVNNYVHALRWETVTTPAGTFDALVLHVVIWLDDETFWRFPTECNYTFWYAPAVRNVVRMVKFASYQEKGGGDMDAGARIRTQNSYIDLVSFTPGA